MSLPTVSNAGGNNLCSAILISDLYFARHQSASLIVDDLEFPFESLSKYFKSSSDKVINILFLDIDMI